MSRHQANFKPNRDFKLCRKCRECEPFCEKIRDCKTWQKNDENRELAACCRDFCFFKGVDHSLGFQM
mgnify:CR=1 FL=1